MVRIGVVGLGRMGKSHAENLRQTPGCEIVTTLAAGKHVFCEKPLGISVADYQKTASLVAEYQDTFMPGFVRRFELCPQKDLRRANRGAVYGAQRDHRDFAPFQLQFMEAAAELLRW